MRAKCKICGEPLDTKTAYLVITFDKNKKEKKAYYCSQEEYEVYVKKKEKASADENKVYQLICEIIGREKIINTILWKEWKIWNAVADNEKIGQYLEENKSYLCSMISRLEDKEFNRIRYLSTILKNKLGDFKPKIVVKEVNESKEPEIEIDTRNDIGLRTNKKKKNIRRKGFAEMED